VTRRRVVGAVAMALVYVGLAAFSAWLSPLARRPVLDGLAPVAPYRWVSPPPELADGNQPPAEGSFEIRLSAEGSEPGVFITTDNQVTVVVDRGAFPSREEDRTVRLTVTPLDPATLGPLPDGLTAFGNALELRAGYEPSGRPIRQVDRSIRFIAVYPTTQTLHATTHELLRSDDGQTWTALPSQDAPGIQQVEASVDRPGYLLVAGELTPNPVTTTPAGGTDPVVVVVLVASAAAMLIGAAFLVRGRGAK
jgi:hypothetical protein